MILLGPLLTLSRSQVAALAQPEPVDWEAELDALLEQADDPFYTYDVFG